jgi:hypothetical protein
MGAAAASSRRPLPPMKTQKVWGIRLAVPGRFPVDSAILHMCSQGGGMDALHLWEGRPC